MAHKALLDLRCCELDDRHLCIARFGMRHDHGHSMDADFYIGDRKLDWNNPDDLPIFQQIVSQGKAGALHLGIFARPEEGECDTDKSGKGG